LSIILLMIKKIKSGIAAIRMFQFCNYAMNMLRESEINWQNVKL